MKIKLYFLDWHKVGKSVDQMEYLKLSNGDFYGDTTFNEDIDLDPEQEAELKKSLDFGYPTFGIMKGNE